MTGVPSTQIPGVYHHRVGDIVVTALSDGTLDRGPEMFHNIARDDAMGLLAASFRPAILVSVNAFLIYSAGRLALVDTGSGAYLGPSAGKLLGNLAAAGVAPGDIDIVILTHMHPDHSAGLTDMTTGKAHYANAELIVHTNEPCHWGDDAAMARGTEREQRLFFQAGRDQIAPYRDRMRMFDRGGEVFPGVTAMPFTGHTPGHTGYMVASGGEQLLIWGDITHVPDVQLARPEVTVVVDSDPAAAAATRARVLDMVATDRLLVTGMHMHYPGFAHVARRAGGGYALVPQAWRTVL